MHMRDDIQILTNGKGSFAMMSPLPISRYSGVFIRHGDDIVKTIESINGADGTFFMPKDEDAILYEHTGTGPMDLILDVRRINDLREWGRSYYVKAHSDCILISFTKSTDSREDTTQGAQEYTQCVAIRGIDLAFNPRQVWILQEYEYDRQRNSQPISRYVFNAGTLNASRLVFAFSQSGKDAIQRSAYLLDNFERIRKAKRIKAPAPGRRFTKTTANSYEMAANSLAGMVCAVDGKTGLYAGLPWFFQFWARDESICLRALDLIGLQKIAKERLFAMIKDVSRYGDAESVQGGLHSADALGWAFLRASQMKLTAAEKNQVRNSLENCIDRLHQFRTIDGLAYNLALETWMDTGYQDDTREGKRIEIQALRLAMYSYLHKLSGNKTYRSLEQRLRKALREEFWTGRYLKDGAGDGTIRPNIFLAAYAYPRLLDRKEWIRCFDHVLPKLWCDWGGLASIDKSSPLFFKDYTGQDNRSYHRGDSWFYVNNIAALVLARIDKKRYKRYIDSIIHAGQTELLERGAIGHMAELSSASEQRSEGCLAQSWSAATYIELVHELFLK